MSIVEKMARAYVEYNRKLHEEAARVEDYENYEWAELGALMAAALTATGLTEAQLEGLANGTMAVVWAPADKAQRDAENRAWDDARAAMLDAHERRKKLAAKEG